MTLSIPAHRTIGLGCMRLSTAPDRDDARGRAVIRTALDAGCTVLDTADAYCHDEGDVGHNERLVASALADWTGDRARIIVATKGGMRRPKGAWLPDGRAKALREACDASRRALGVEMIDLYQLHVIDPKTPIETSVRALARLQVEGKIRDVGLCNVTVGQIRAAQSIVAIASVQVSASVLDDENLRNGVVEYCGDNGIRVMAHRPLGGTRVSRLAKDATLREVAARHGVTSEEVALAWLMSFRQGIVPIPGASRLATASSIGRVLAVALDDEDRAVLDARFAGRLLRVPRVDRRPGGNAGGDVVIVMGMPGAGKSTLARELEAEGYERLNRDDIGGSLAGLASRLDVLLADGHTRVVLDNTYPTRGSRNEVIETAWARGVPVRCVWLTTDVANAQINSIQRMLDAHGALPTPDEIRALGKEDPRFLLPDAQFRYERTLEPPTEEEGFASVETRSFSRAPAVGTNRAIIMDVDDLLAYDDSARRATLERYRQDGWLLMVHAWRQRMDLASMRTLLGDDVEITTCRHAAGPPVCWCRKPIPGTVLAFAARHDVALDRSVVVGTSVADRTMADRLGARFESSSLFFGG